MKILYVDTETTGLSAYKNDVIQIGGIIEINGKQVEEFNIRCQPFDYNTIEAKALECNGMTIDELKKLQSPEKAYQQLTKILNKYVNKYDKTDKFIPAGQNVKFDLDMLQQFFVKNKDSYFYSFIDRHFLDLQSISAFFQMLGYIEFPNLKLETVANKLGIQFDAHDALEDIRATRAAFKAFNRFLAEESKECH